jgi:hypothetical protein
MQGFPESWKLFQGYLQCKKVEKGHTRGIRWLPGTSHNPTKTLIINTLQKCKKKLNIFFNIQYSNMQTVGELGSNVLLILNKNKFIVSKPLLSDSQLLYCQIQLQQQFKFKLLKVLNYNFLNMYFIHLFRICFNLKVVTRITLTFKALWNGIVWNYYYIM